MHQYRIRMISARKVVVIVVVIMALIGIHSIERFGFYNMTDSAPKGFYNIVHPPNYIRGQYVVFPIPENVVDFVKSRKWGQADKPLLKKIGATEGDLIIITDEGLYINDQYCGPVLVADREDLLLPRIRGTFKVPPGEFLPVSPYDRSFDGRYFGTVPLKNIQYAVEPYAVIK